MKKYGHIISKLRKKEGFTQEQLGKKLNVSYQAVSKWENNLSEPDLETIEKITEVFGISMSEFFDMAKDSENINKNLSKHENKNINTDKGFIKTKPWYLISGLGILIIILSLCAFLIPVKYPSNKIYQMVDPSVFCITAEGSLTKQAGSGFFINDTGLAVTNYHVIQNCTSGEVQLNNGKTYKIKTIVGCDENRDIAIIQIDIKKSKGVKLGNSNKIKVGDTVYAIGYPESFVLGSAESTLTKGIISKTSYTVEGNTYIQTTTPMTHGNSGGVLINEQGKIIGITSGTLTDGIVDYMNLAIPINQIKNIKHNINVSLEEYYKMHKTFCFYSDGVVIGSQDFVSGNKIIKIKAPTKIGYTFDDWYTTESFEVKFNFDNPVFDQIACYAKWIPNTYTICFDANGGSGTMNDAIATYDEELILPSNSYQLEHYNFKGWKYQDQDIIFTNNDTIKNLTTENNDVITLTAIWEMQKYTIVFNGNNADSGTMQNIVLNYDQVINLPTNQFSKTGYLFNGWTYNGQTYQEMQEVSKLYETEGVIEFIVDWEPITYTIRFTHEGQSYEQDFVYDEPQKLLSNTFSKDYFNFSSWYCAELKGIWHFQDKADVLNLTETQGTVFVFVARFSEYTYSIRYNPEQNVDLENGYMVTYKYSEKGQAESCMFNKTGYKFVHWVDDNENVYECKAVNNNGVITYVGTPICKLSAIHNDVLNFYAVWEEITYNAYYKYELKNETKYTSIGTKTYEEQFTLIEPEYIDDGYEFTHWQVYSEIYSKNETVSRLTWSNKSNVYIEAKYQPKQYTINFDGNNADSGAMEPLLATFDTYTTLPENNFVKDGYIFVGWDYEGKTFIDCETNIINTTAYSQNITLKAIWIQQLEGEGTIESPYLIKNMDDFRYVETLCRTNSNKTQNYKLTTDLDFSKIYFNSFKYYNGTFDGNGHKLLNVNLSDDNSGFIIYGNGTIKNLGIEGNYESLKDDDSKRICFGAVVTRLNTGNLENCYSKINSNIGTIGNGFYGGLVGIADFGCYLTNCYSEFKLNVKDADQLVIGGLIGSANGNVMMVENCYAVTEINVRTSYHGYSSFIGGLIGETTCHTASISNSFVSANIEYLAENTYSTSEFVLSDIIANSETINMSNVYNSSLSSIKFTYQNDDMTLNLTGTVIEDSNLKSQEFVIENIFLTSGSWTFEEMCYPKLSIFKSEEV